MQNLNFGEKRTTADLEGEVVSKSDKKIDDEKEVKNILKSFLGKQTQIPPKYSAIKINGKKLYEYARNGEDVEVPEREIEIYDIELINFDKENQIIKFKVSCSKGTYIRTLCEDIAEKLDTFGFMKSLRRIEVGDFTIEEAIRLDDLEKNVKIYTIEEIFKDLEKVTLNQRKQKLFLNGVKLTFDLPDGLYNVYSENKKYIGLGLINNKLLKRDIVI